MDNDMMGKIIEYIGENEKTRQLILNSFSALSSNEIEIDDEKKKKAAYALNMCTVSVSQIIDYEDLNVLEQEYDAILNNLNLEQIPKDEALLSILKQLLDTITYFRIEAGEKEMIEKEYQQKMKNAIWSAVPNFGLIVAGGNPITMAISLASQVGIGYMNYRRKKSEYGLENERKKWELQKAAIEQFNGLRRELFDTAWRLADTYDFPDGYRLTEKQINQYNRILLDQDEVRKFERLESIKDCFEAYPPFWYYIGNAANYISGAKELKLSCDTREFYRNKAIEYFDKFRELNRFSILREDQLAASCALEYVDLLLTDGDYDKNNAEELLDSATKTSRNQNDILELCALSYLKIGNQDKASVILRILVNEDYNRIINAQLLSSIYVYKRNRTDYELLATRVDEDYLFPMPENDEDIELLQTQFGSKQKEVLKQKYRIVIKEYLDKYSIKWNKLTSEFELGRDYPDSFFLDTPKARAERDLQARYIYSNSNKKEYYQQRMKEVGYELNILCILNEMIVRLFESSPFSDYQLRERVEDVIRGRISDKKNEINELQDAMNNVEFSLSAYRLSQRISLRKLVEKAFDLVTDYALSQTDEANINDITYLESSLRTFCMNNGLEQPEIAVNRGRMDSRLFEDTTEPFKPQLFGPQAVAAKKNSEFMAEMASYIKETINAIDLKDDQTSIYFRDTSEYNGYFRSTTFERHPDVKGHSIMVLKDNTKRRFDLIFTTDGIVSVVKEKVHSITPYDEVKLKGDSILLYRNEMASKRYKTESFDVHILFDLITKLGNRFLKSIEDKTEYVEGVIGPKELDSWFKQRTDAMVDGVTRVYAIPSPGTLAHLGYHFEDDFDVDKNLLQFYFDSETGDILGLRLIQFDSIDTNFQAYLLEHKGMIKVNLE